jgi:hypothetical protein
MTTNNVTELWYNNPAVLFKDINQFIPLNSLSPNQKINSLIRLAMYYTLIVLILFNNSSNKISLLYISLIIALSSFLINPSEDFNQNVVPNIILTDESNCQKSTPNNPFMNFTLGDFIENPKREKACSYVDNKELVKRNFNKVIDMPVIKESVWSNNLSDRNFYTMPNTAIVNGQEEFAKWCFGDSGRCKTKGEDCLKVVDPIYHIGRITKI